MLRKPSLKRLILALVMGAMTLVWIATTILTYFDAREALNDLLDAHLAQASTLVVAEAAHELEEIQTDHAPLLHKYSRRIAFQVWEKGTQLRLHSANAPDHPMGGQTQGFSTARIDGEPWRVFSVWDESGKLLIHVAEQVEVRDQLARDIASHLLMPLWIALALLAFLIWWAVGAGLRPLTRLTNEISQRAPDNLAALDATAAPAEVAPLIARLNQLFQRIDQTLANERRFTADAAHELRTPVAAIKAQAQVARGATQDAERQHALDQAITGCDRATHLIEQLLTLARLDSIAAGSATPCVLPEIAATVVADLAPAALDRDVQLALLDHGAPTVAGLPALLAILLRNLVDNAVRHTGRGTTVLVEVSTVAGGARLTVTDDGPGLPADELEKISQRFYRPLGTTASGSGLGLSIVQRIAELHHATLSFSSDAEKSGLKVTVRFPPAVQ